MNIVPKTTQKGKTAIWGKGQAETHKMQM